MHSRVQGLAELVRTLSQVEGKPNQCGLTGLLENPVLHLPHMLKKPARGRSIEHKGVDTKA